MGFSLFKKKDASSSPSTASSVPYSSSNGSTGSSSKLTIPNQPLKSKSSSSTFSKLFRSTPSSNQQDRKLLDVTASNPSSSNSLPSKVNTPLRRRTSSTPDPRTLKYNQPKSWRDSTVSLDVFEGRVARETNFESPVVSSPASRFRSFMGADGLKVDDDEEAVESLSSPSHLRASLVRNNDPEIAEKRSSRFFGGSVGGAKKRTGSVASSFNFMGDKENSSRKSSDSAGFEVKSFRVVSRVQEGPYQHQSHSSVSLQSPTPVVVAPITKSSTTEFRPPPPVLTGESERSPSPTISVEAFRLASARSKSSSSLNLLVNTNNLDESEQPRPRFEPRRSSILIYSVASLTPPPPRPHLSTSRSRPDSFQSISPNSPVKASRQSNRASTSEEESKERSIKRDSARSDLGLWDDETRLIALYGAGDRTSIHARPNLPRATSSTSRLDLNEKARPSSFYSTSSTTPKQHYPQVSPVKFESIESPTTPTARTRAPEWNSQRPPVSWGNSSASFTQFSKSNSRQFKKWGEESSSDEDDDVPLAQLKSASTSDLRLAVKGLKLEGGKVELESEEEVLCASPVEESQEEREDRERVNYQADTGRPRSTAFGLGHPRGTQRRSVSTLAYSTSPSLSSPPLSNIISPVPTLGQRSFSSPTSPQQLESGFDLINVPALPVSSPTTSASVSPTFDQRNSTSSVSTTSDSGTSSLLLTPKDHSPVVSTVGVKPTNSPSLSERAVKFDVEGATNNEAERKWNNRLSALQPLPGKSSMSSTGSKYSTNRTMANSSPPLVHTPSNSDLKVSRRQSSMSENVPIPPPVVKTGDVYDRMKVRHKAETLKAIALGKDLNGSGGILDPSDDDDAPLSSLGGPANGGRNRNSAYFSQPPQFNPVPPHLQYQQQQPQQQFYSPQSSMGGYSPYALAPAGVDPYLYASLPMDQKMGLHVRAAQMAQMMHGYSLQARAESQGGWETGSNVSGGAASEIGGGGGGGGIYGNEMNHRLSMNSMQMQMPMGYGYGGGMYQQQPQQAPPPSSNRLPPFAPSFASSQPFFQPSPYQSQPPFSGMNQNNFYNNPVYASSDIGISSGGGGTGGKVKRGKVGSSAIGVGRR